MIEGLINEYLSKAEIAATVDYSDKKSVRKFNASSDRMREIVDEIVGLGEAAVMTFASLLEIEPAAPWAVHHLVEKADLDSATLSRCFARVEQAIMDAKAKGDPASAMGEEMWLKELRAKKAMDECK
ncbi:hypothetical protein [Planctopirus ephydatiae]|uniref:hypothetical protein n=1 Tax=Planctopirus ephydatiae TaxID=2528019 RepID=UPI00119F27EB|nr:hypothetical protein [Planctopirus ephydatiae]